MTVHPHVRGEYAQPGWHLRPHGRFIPTCVGNTGHGRGVVARRAVHPHVRGEYVAFCPDGAGVGGSSPRAWGIRLALAGEHELSRFIPTCVGNTLITHLAHCRAPVHPHVRGEYTPSRHRSHAHDGSSPRAWGILLDDMGGDTKVRFIPTCVGNTCPMPLARPVTTVHPHVRGEYKWATENVYGVTGSSPRAWGIPFRHTQRTGHARFIPTCVGNTYLFNITDPTNLVHPHVRGEYTTSEMGMFKIGGSSPRAWGIPHNKEDKTMAIRFIPTCVGNTASSPRCVTSAAVHPHVRGEYEISRPSRFVLSGSSPRAWGIPTWGKVNRATRRFIPTCVGNTHGKPLLCYGVTVHPHVRGEYKPVGMYGAPVDGSSPRAWGIRQQVSSRGARLRFIPTCVGNTQ